MKRNRQAELLRTKMRRIRDVEIYKLYTTGQQDKSQRLTYRELGAKYRLTHTAIELIVHKMDKKLN